MQPGTMQAAARDVRLNDEYHELRMAHEAEYAEAEPDFMVVETTATLGEGDYDPYEPEWADLYTDDVDAMLESGYVVFAEDGALEWAS